MGEWLLEQGLDENRVIVENRAPDTVGNALNTYNILVEEYPQVESVCLITSDYHVPRGCVLFNSKFILEATKAGTKPLNIVANAGFETGSQGYETISLQANGVASMAGISLSGSVKLSTVAYLTVELQEAYETGNDLNLKVTATYNTGYTKDVTDAVENLVRIEPLISAGKPVTTSGSVADGKTSDINDGYKFSYLKTDYNSDIIMDLEGLYHIDEIQVYDYGKAPRSHHYTLYTSVDGINYEYFGEKNNDEIASIKTGQVFEKEDCVARFVKIVMTYNSTSTSHVYLGELEVYGKFKAEASAFKGTLEALIEKYETMDLSGYSNRTVEKLMEKVAQAKDVYADEEATQNAVDAACEAIEAAANLLAKPVDAANKMPVETTENSAVVTLDGIYNLEEIVVVTDSDGETAYNYHVYVSTNGTEWTKAAEQTGDVIATEEGYAHEVDYTLEVKYIKVESEAALDVTKIHAYGDEINNIALGKPVTFGNSTTGNDPKVINDGDRTN